MCVCVCVCDDRQKKKKKKTIQHSSINNCCMQLIGSEYFAFDNIIGFTFLL